VSRDRSETGALTPIRCTDCGEIGATEWYAGWPFHPHCLDQQPTTNLKDRLARIIAAAVYCPKPHMSSDIWQRLPPHQRRNAEDAASGVMEELNLGC
jgi:hypothetical protein